MYCIKLNCEKCNALIDALWNDEDGLHTNYTCYKCGNSHDINSEYVNDLQIELDNLKDDEETIKNNDHLEWYYSIGRFV